MVRIYASLAEYLLLSLLYVKSTLGSRGTEGLVENAITYWYKSKAYDNTYSRVTSLVRNMLDRRHRSSFEEVDDAIESLQKSLEASNHSNGQGDGDLIDLIVNTLQLPHARSALSGKVLEQLKKAILLPDERAKLTEMIEAREMSCMSCGRPLHSGEMVTYGRPGEFYCQICEIPRHVACSKCKEGCVPVPDKIYKAYGKARTCDTCAGVAESKPTVVVSQAPVGQPAPTITVRAEPTDADVIALNRYQTEALRQQLAQEGRLLGIRARRLSHGFRTATAYWDHPANTPTDPLPPNSVEED